MVVCATTSRRAWSASSAASSSTRGHETIRGLCGELGLELDDFDQDDPKLARDVWFFDGQRIPDEAVVEAFTPIAAKMDEAWETITGEIGHLRRAERRRGDRPACRSPSGSTERRRRRAGSSKLLDVGYTTEYGLEIAEQSAWNLLMLIDTNPDPFRIFGDSDERFHIRGGNDQVPTQARRGAGRPGRDRHPARGAIAQGADGSYQLALRSDGDVARGRRRPRRARAAVHHAARGARSTSTLPPVKRKAIDELGYGTNAKLMVGFSERTLAHAPAGSNGSVLTDLPFQLTWESTRLQPGKAGILVGFTGGKRGLEMGDRHRRAEQAEKFAPRARARLPGIGRASASARRASTGRASSG